MCFSNTDVLKGRRLFHVTPLHYVPQILARGGLCSTERLGYHWGRTSARKRDRMLGVDRYIHLALNASSPLLTHKLDRGFPHVVLQFRTEGFDNLNLAALPNNTKAWRAKWQSQPVKDNDDIARLLRSHDEHGRYPSLEILVEDFLPFGHLEAILTIAEEEATLVLELCRQSSFSADLAVRVAGNLRPPDYSAKNLDVISDYFSACNWGQNFPVPPSLASD